MTIAARNLVQTQEGVRPIEMATGTLALWSGQKWVDTECTKIDGGPQVEVALKSGLIFRCSMDNAVLTYGKDYYTWRKAAELTAEHHVCINLSEPYTRLPIACEYLEAYWWGRMLQSGQFSSKNGNPDVRFSVSPGRPNGRIRERIMGGLRDTCHIKKWSVDMEKVWHTFTVRICGRHFAADLEEYGVVVEDGRIARIPAGWLLQPTRYRRAAARGLIAAAGYADRTWHLEDVGPNPLRIQDHLRLFSSIGMTAAAFGPNIHVPTWIASLEVDSPTPIPKVPHLTCAPGTPFDRVADLLEAMPKPVPKHGLLQKLQEIIDARGPLHPAAVRAGWRNLRLDPPKPVYDTVPVVSVTPCDARSLYRCHVRDVDHAIAVSGCVIGDDTR